MNRQQRQDLDRHITGNYGEDSVTIGLADETITVKTEVEVGLERVAYTLCAALEGGSTFWCAGVNLKPADYLGYEWAHEAIAAGGKFTFRIFEEDDIQTPKLTRPEALKLMAEKYPRHFMDMVNENEDAETGDVLFQLLCFGELVYG